MESKDIRGTGQTSFNGATHALDEDGNTFCGTVGGDGQLFNDDWAISGKFMAINNVGCKRCIKRLEKEGIFV
jgi:hypothetical protein